MLFVGFSYENLPVQKLLILVLWILNYVFAHNFTCYFVRMWSNAFLYEGRRMFDNMVLRGIFGPKAACRHGKAQCQRGRTRISFRKFSCSRLDKVIRWIIHRLFPYHALDSCFFHIIQGFSNPLSPPKFEPRGPSDSLTVKRTTQILWLKSL